MVFDAAVIGLGTMGTYACLELARRRLAVIGFDQFEPPHERQPYRCNKGVSYRLRRAPCVCSVSTTCRASMGQIGSRGTDYLSPSHRHAQPGSVG